MERWANRDMINKLYIPQSEAIVSHSAVSRMTVDCTLHKCTL